MIGVLGSVARLKILKHLSRKDRYLSELMELAGMDSRNAKHHLNKLVGAGILESYMKGRRRYYRLVKEIKLEVRPPPNGRFLMLSGKPGTETT